MSTFSYAYGPELGPRVSARNLYRKIEREIESLAPAARTVLETMLAKEFGPNQEDVWRVMAQQQARSVLLAQQSPFSAQRQQAALHNGGLGSAFGNLF